MGHLVMKLSLKSLLKICSSSKNVKLSLTGATRFHHDSSDNIFYSLVCRNCLLVMIRGIGQFDRSKMHCIRADKTHKAWQRKLHRSLSPPVVVARERWSHLPFRSPVYHNICTAFFTQYTCWLTAYKDCSLLCVL